MPMVYPSGAARATSATPMRPPAPALKSVTTVWPSALETRSLNVRAITSLSPPAGQGTTKRMGLAGHSCAQVGNAVTRQKAAAKRRSMNLSVSAVSLGYLDASP